MTLAEQILCSIDTRIQWKPDLVQRESSLIGLFVAPGFIDVHCHADFTVLDPRNPRDFKLRQGITQGGFVLHGFLNPPNEITAGLDILPAL